MKKLILCLGILIGLVSLTSCEESTSVTFVDSNGETQTLKVTATEDKETVQALLDYAQLANYDDVTSFKLKEKVSLSASLSKDLCDIYGLDSKSKILGSAEAIINFSKEQGLDISASGNLSFGNDFEASLNADVIYEGGLDQMLSQDQFVYVDAGYELKSISNSSNVSIKKAINTLEFLDETKDAVEDILENFYPLDHPTFTEPTTFTVEDFYNTFQNSKLVVSSVKNNVIYIQADLSLADVLTLISSEIEEVAPFLQLDTRLVFSYGIEASTGRLCEYSFKFDDVYFLNCFANLFIAMPSSSEVIELIETFEFESKMTIEYNIAQIRTLTSEEKAKYTIF